MKRKIVTDSDNNVWLGNIKTIKKSDAKTIKELVDKLRTSGRKNPLIKRIYKNDAVTLLIDIGLSVFPFAVKYRKQVQNHLKESPEKINIENIFATLEVIASQKKEGS